MIIAKDKIEFAIKKANGLNYNGKRLDSVKAQIAEDISFELYETRKYSAAIREVLDNPDNWPKKPEKVKAERIKAVRDDLPLEGGQLLASVKDWSTIKGQSFIITSAQNNTDVHANLLASLRQYSTFLDAPLLVSKYFYNKNGFQNGEGEKGIHFNPALTDFFIEENVYLNNERFAFLAGINTLPTAVYPLSGFAEIFGSYSGAIGHAQITAESIPALKGQEVRRMYSTGTVTQRNYIQQKAGQKAEPLHCYGALLVEFDDEGEFWVRQLQTMDDSGVFYDLEYKITPEGVSVTSDHVAALQYGDIHAEKLNLDVAAISWGQTEKVVTADDVDYQTQGNNLLDFLEPRYQFIHDVHDFTSRNHHNRASGHFIARQYFEEHKGSVKQDLIETASVLVAMARPWSQIIVVESNHDLALTRWLDDAKYQPSQDPENARLFFDLNSAMYRAIENKDDTFNVLSYALNEYVGMETPATFLFTDQSFSVAGIEMGMHGHNGINGSRGQPKQFKKLGVPSNTGHTHSATIYGGVYTAGVSGNLDMGYNQGAGSWTHTHIVTYENGQRTLIDIKKGQFRA
jgi:hypothetical protein